MLLFENAMLESGYSLPDPNALGQRMEKVLKYNLGLSRDETVSPYEIFLDDNDDDEEEKKMMIKKMKIKKKKKKK